VRPIPQPSPRDTQLTCGIELAVGHADAIEGGGEVDIQGDVSSLYDQGSTAQPAARQPETSRTVPSSAKVDRGVPTRSSKASACEETVSNIVLPRLLEGSSLARRRPEAGVHLFRLHSFTLDYSECTRGRS